MPGVRSRPNRRSLSEWTLSTLYGEIFSGDLPAGSPLVEVDLVERLGVSRSPVREALRELELNGVVYCDPVNGRRVVLAFGADDVDELYTMRAALERIAHHRAASRLSEQDLNAAAAALNAMETADATTRDGRANQFEADFRLHEVVARAASMPRLVRVLSGLWLQTRVLLQQLDAAGIYPLFPEVSAVRDDHRAVVAALKTRDAELAADSIERHLLARRDVLVRAIRMHGGLK